MTIPGILFTVRLHNNYDVVVGTEAVNIFSVPRMKYTAHILSTALSWKAIRIKLKKSTVLTLKSMTFGKKQRFGYPGYSQKKDFAPRGWKERGI